MNKICQTNPIQTQFVLSEVEWISQVTHFINEQRTMNNQQFPNEPNPVLSEVEWISQVTHLINEPRTMNNQEFPNEPNFRPNKRKFCYDKVLYQ